MDEPEQRTKHQYDLGSCWKALLLRGLPSTLREAFNAGFDAGFRAGVKKGRRDALGERQLKIPGT